MVGEGDLQLRHQLRMAIREHPTLPGAYTSVDRSHPADLIDLSLAVPTEQAALKCLYLATRALDPTGKGKARWAMRWKPALNAFAITFEGRITLNGN